MINNSNDFDISVNETDPETEALTKAYIESITGQGVLDSSYEGISYIPESCSLDGFIDLVQKLMEIDQESKEYKVILVDDFARNNIFEDPKNPATKVLGVIGYQLVAKQPGAFHQTNELFSAGVKEVRPSFRGISRNKIDDLSTVTYHLGQLFDNEIAFCVYARSNKEANEIVNWFENLMQVHKKFFALKGVIKYYFRKRESDSVVKEGDNVVHKRPVIYWLRTEETYQLTEQAVNQIILKIKTT